VSAKGGIQAAGNGLPISAAGGTEKYKLRDLSIGEEINDQSRHENGQNIDSDGEI
jgi:hypothetical protein